MSDKIVVNQTADDVVVEEETLTIPLNDVKLVVEMIDVVSKRDRFFPGEFKAVGNYLFMLRIKLKRYN